MANNRITRQTGTFPEDTTGRNITQDFMGVTATSGLVSINTTAQYMYVTTPALTGSMTFSVATSSTQITDHLVIMVAGGAATYSVALGTAITGNVSSISVPAGKNGLYDGWFNGSVYVGTLSTTV